MKSPNIPLVQACAPESSIDMVIKQIAKRPGFSLGVITDCRDSNASFRIKLRLHSLFHKTQVSFCGLKSKDTELESALCLIDAIDAKGGGASPGVILHNIAPRECEKVSDANGSRFCYLVIGQLLIVATLRPRALSLVQRFFGIETIRVFDTHEVLTALVSSGDLEPEWAAHIEDSQFRSYTFQPLVAALLCQGKIVPYQKERLLFKNLGPVIAYIDTFGIAKTTITTSDCSPFPRDGDEIGTKFGTLRYYRRLNDAPHGKPVITTGSSGLGAGTHYRFLEIVTRGGNATETFGLNVGDEIF